MGRHPSGAEALVSGFQLFEDLIGRHPVALGFRKRTGEAADLRGQLDPRKKRADQGGVQECATSGKAEWSWRVHSSRSSKTMAVALHRVESEFRMHNSCEGEAAMKKVAVAFAI